MFYCPPTLEIKWQKYACAFFEFLLAWVGRNIMIYIVYVIPIGEYIL